MEGAEPLRGADAAEGAGAEGAGEGAGREGAGGGPASVVEFLEPFGDGARREQGAGGGTEGAAAGADGWARLGSDGPVDEGFADEGFPPAPRLPPVQSGQVSSIPPY